MIKLYLKFVDTRKYLELNLAKSTTIADLKKIAENYFKIDRRTMIADKSEKQIVIEYAKLNCDLNDDWLLGDLPLPSGCVLKCRVVEHKNPDMEIFLKFKREWVKIYDCELAERLETISILELRIWLGRRFGLPLSAFRLKAMSNLTSKLIDLYDDHFLSEYEHLQLAAGRFHVETWSASDNLIQYAIKGYPNQVMESLSSDEFIKQYQMQLALYIGAFHGNTHLCDVLITMGARSDRPVGEHPCRQWCQVDYLKLEKRKNSVSQKRLNYLKLENLKCPVHVAIENGHLRTLNQMSKRDPHILEHVDGYGCSPLRLSLRNSHTDEVKRRKQREVARYLMSKQFDSRIAVAQNESLTGGPVITPAVSAIVASKSKRKRKVPTITLKMFYMIKCWVDRARERVLVFHGAGKSTLPKRKVQMRTGLVGNKVLVDGFNNNFKEYPNSYDRLRSKYQFYYFKDEEDRNRNGLSEIYFRTIGMFKTPVTGGTKTSNNKRLNQSIGSAQSEQALNRSLRNDFRSVNTISNSNPSSNNKRNPKAQAKWRNIIARVMFIWTKVKYYKTFVKLGVRIELNGANLAELDYFANDLKEIRKFNQEILENSEENKKGNKKHHKTADSSLSDRPSSQNSHTRYSQQEIYMSTVVYFEEQLMRSRRQSELARRPTLTTTTLNTAALAPPPHLLAPHRVSREEFIKKIMEEYRKTYQDDTKENAAATKIFNEVTRLSRSKSWLQQLDFGTRVATAKVRRNFDPQQQQRRRIQTAK